MGIVRPSLHHSVAALLLIHRAGTLIRLRDAKTVTPRHPLVPGDQSGRPSETHFSSFGFVRPHAALEWMFDHCENIMLPLGGSTVAHSPSGHADPTPGRENRYAKPSSGTSQDVQKQDTLQRLFTIPCGLEVRILGIVELS